MIPAHPPSLAASDALFVALVGATALLVVAALWRSDVIRPASFRRAALRETGALPWWGWIAAAFAVIAALILGQLFGASVAVAAGFERPGGRDTPTATSVVIGGGAYTFAITAGLVLVAAIRRGSPGRGSNAGLILRPTDAFHGLGWFLLIAPVVWLVSIGTVALAYRLGTEPDPIAHVTLRRIAEEPADPWIWGTIAIAVLAAPITEELIYRVFLQSGLLALLGRPWLAITLASAFFAAMHYSAADWYALPSLAAFGFALGLAYERSRRLGVPIVMHALFNLANVGLVLWGRPS